MAAKNLNGVEAVPIKEPNVAAFGELDQSCLPLLILGKPLPCAIPLHAAETVNEDVPNLVHLQNVLPILAVVRESNFADLLQVNLSREDPGALDVIDPDVKSAVLSGVTAQI